MIECYVCNIMYPDRDVFRVGSIRGGRLDLFVCKNCKVDIKQKEQGE